MRQLEAGEAQDKIAIHFSYCLGGRHTALELTFMRLGKALLYMQIIWLVHGFMSYCFLKLLNLEKDYLLKNCCITGLFAIYSL